MSRPSEFLCTERCIDHIERANLPLYALRLVHACHFLIDQSQGLSMQHMAMHRERHYTVRCRSLMETTGTPKANDFQMIRRGVEQLRGNRIFSQLHLHEHGKKLTFHFDKSYAYDAIRKKSDKFGLLDADDLRALRTPEQIMFYTRSVMVLRSDYPMFTLPWTVERHGSWNQSK